MTVMHPILDQEAIIELIPQKPPMVMIDKLWSSRSEETISGLLVKKDNIFCDGKQLLEPGLIENVAQTVAIQAGYAAMETAKASNNKIEKPLGYIAAIKNCNIYHLPSIDQELRTQIVVEKIVMNVSMIKGTITSQGKTIMDCEMRIFQKTEK